jgi:hypothetical protein
MGLIMWGGSGGYSQDAALVDVQPEFPKITRQPEDQAVWLGSNVTFTVSAENGEAFQWARNGVILEGQTNATLTLENIGTAHVGIYSCNVLKGDEAVPTRSATLNAMALLGGDGGPLTIFGIPLLGNGGQGGSCPGPFVGYVNFIKPGSQGWGWAPTAGASVHTATDTNRTDTHLIYIGKFLDSGCGATNVTVDPVISTKYRFTVFFPDNVPTNTYSIVLSGFNP